MPSSPVGRVGEISTAVRGPGLPGEIDVTVAGQPETYIAYGTERIARGAAALVVRDRGDRGVDVVSWVFPPGLGVEHDAAGRSER